MNRTLVVTALLICCGSAQGQDLLGYGFEQKVAVRSSNQELARQRDMWMMEVQLKPVRMVWSDEVDPRTGEVTREEVWYLPWRAINRPLSSHVVDDAEPVNALDPLPGPTQFIPQFTLVTYDNPDNEIPNQVLTDEILPGALINIRQIEQRFGIPYKDSVSTVRDLPELTPADAESQNWIYGVATWRNIDPDTDFFKVVCHGFSNGYVIRAADGGGSQVWRKVIVQRFARPGDRFDPNLKEFQFSSKAEWIYQPDATEPHGDPAAAE